MAAPIAVIFGAGPGAGAGIARALAPTHSLLLMSRSLPGSLSKLGLGDLPQDRIHAAKFDGPASFASAIEDAKRKWPGAGVKVGICHAGVPFAPGPFLERTTEDMRTGLESAVQAWDFSQALIPQLLSSGGGTLIVTGATMALRGSSGFAAMAPACFARRALAQSLAREFGPQGVHVAHVIVDGLIDTDRVRGMMGEAKEEGSRLVPEDIGKVYLDLVEQPPSVWTHELDIRPMKEKW